MASHLTLCTAFILSLYGLVRWAKKLFSNLFSARYVHMGIRVVMRNPSPRVLEMLKLCSHTRLPCDSHPDLIQSQTQLDWKNFDGIKTCLRGGLALPPYLTSFHGTLTSTDTTVRHKSTNYSIKGQSSYAQWRGCHFSDPPISVMLQPAFTHEQKPEIPALPHLRKQFIQSGESTFNSEILDLRFRGVDPLSHHFTLSHKPPRFSMTGSWCQ